MFLIKCMVCGRSSRIKAESRQGRAELLFYNIAGWKQNVIIFPTHYEEIKIKCPTCGNEISGR